jgi:hypothetical protein
MLPDQYEYLRSYDKYIGETESPHQYHRWASLSVIAAALGRRVIMPFGHGSIFPNQYIILVGSPGAKKSSAISPAKRVLAMAGYKPFAGDLVSKERFLFDLSGGNDDEMPDLEAMEAYLDDPVCEQFICNGELIDFVGQKNFDFLTLLNTLWDNLPEYKHQKLSSKSVIIQKPTVNILGAATVKGISLAIPPEAIGTGIMSRLILVYGASTGKKITFPTPPRQEDAEICADFLREIMKLKGFSTLTPEAQELADSVYQNYESLKDARLIDYTNRRFTHVLKVAILIAASRLSTTITAADIKLSNTLLVNAENGMTSALGEVGSDKRGPQIHSILSALKAARGSVAPQDLWERVAKEIPIHNEFLALMQNLAASRRVTMVGSKYLFNGEDVRVFPPELCDYTMLDWREIIRQEGGE